MPGRRLWGWPRDALDGGHCRSGRTSYRHRHRRRGGDSNIGPKLPAMFRRAAIRAVELNVIQPAHIHGEGKLMAPITMSRISAAVTAEGLATEDEVQQILTELNEAAADCEIVMSLPRIFQVWGKRGNGDCRVIARDF